MIEKYHKKVIVKRISQENRLCVVHPLWRYSDLIKVKNFVNVLKNTWRNLFIRNYTISTRELILNQFVF